MIDRADNSHLVNFEARVRSLWINVKARLLSAWTIYFEHQRHMLVSYLINLDCNPSLEWIAWCIKKF